MIGSLPLEEFSYGLDVTGLDPASLGDALRDVTSDVMSDPARMGTWLTTFSLAEQAVGINLMRRLNGETPEPAATAAEGDKRFTDPAWRSNPFLFGAFEEYLVRTRAAHQLIDLSRVPERTRRKARFALTVMLDAVSPSNVPWLNPAVVKEAVDTGGMSLVRGMQQFLDDLEHNGGQPRQVDASQFRLGENIAVSPGRVVFRNELIELIAYEPTTATVHELPLLMSPPWINKYYVMDLAPGRSFVEWAVAHGHRTFMISYRNPDASMSHLTMDDYLRLGLLTAIDVIERLTGASRMNVAALCLGGTLAVLALAHLAALGDERIASCTVTNTLVDFSEPGDLGVFTDETTIERLEKRMAERGYLDSSEMAGTFNWMRANDLVWSYVVNNWFMGRKPPAFDILAWNADSTRMPAAMHSQYLRACYLRNALVTPGAFTACGTPIDLGKVRTPMFVLGAEADHIAPWRSTYATTQLIGGPSMFVRSNSGHIAGIVNPPGNKKSVHWEGAVVKGQTPDDWLEGAAKHEGSWWGHWADWIAAHAGPQVKPVDLPRGEPAPGHYVRNETAAPFDATTAETPA